MRRLNTESTSLILAVFAALVTSNDGQLSELRVRLPLGALPERWENVALDRSMDAEIPNRLRTQASGAYRSGRPSGTVIPGQ